MGHPLAEADAMNSDLSDQIDGWAEHAQALAEFVLENLFVRQDAYGEFHHGKTGVTRKTPVTAASLEEHFRGHRCLGAHTTSVGNQSLSGALDLDQDQNPHNREIALALGQELRNRGYAPLIEESRENRFHVWIRFPEPVPTLRLYALLQAVAEVGISLGLESVECFPKQPALGGSGDVFGNWLRLPGRHPSVPFCSRVFDPETDDWLEGADAALAVLDWRASAAHILPDAVPSRPTPAPQRVTAPEGAIAHLHRNVTLTSLAGTMRRRGFEVDAIEAALQVTNQSRCQPPLPDDEVRRIAASLGRYAPAIGLNGTAAGAMIEVGEEPVGSGNRFRDAAVLDTDLFAMDLQRPASILGDGLLPATEYGVLYSRTGFGKTWLADQLAYAMARGEPWHDIATAQGRVGIISLEMTAYYHRERLRRISGGEPTGKILTITVEMLGGTFFDLLDDHQQAELVDWASGEGIQLLIVDPLALSFSGSETNEEHVGPLLSFARSFPVRTNCGLLLLHHEPKGPQGGAVHDDLSALRGLSRIGDFAALLMRLRGHKDGFKELVFAKVRHAAAPESLWFKLDEHGVPLLTDPPQSLRAEKATRKDMTFNLILHSRHGMTAAAIQSRLAEKDQKVSVRTVNRYLDELQEEYGIVAREAPDGSGRLWFADEEGE